MTYRKPKYYIQLAGLRGDSIPDVVLDNSYLLRQIHPYNTIYILPIKNYKHPSFNELVFYTNFLAYQYDLPAFFSTVDRRIKRAPITPIFKAKNPVEYPDYYFYNKSLELAFSAIAEIRFGSGEIFFGGDDFINKEVINLNTNKIRNVSKEISLYSMALNQLDPLSEYLNYYRVIESVSRSNGKTWIKNNIEKIYSYTFGKLLIKDWINRKTKNLWTIYKRKAVIRLNQLKQSKNYDDIARYLYNYNRCGIAHGKDNIITQSNSINLSEVIKDMYLLKLLARIAIDDKNNNV